VLAKLEFPVTKSVKINISDLANLKCYTCPTGDEVCDGAKKATFTSKVEIFFTPKIKNV
jgi:hypothetical protein